MSGAHREVGNIRDPDLVFVAPEHLDPITRIHHSSSNSRSYRRTRLNLPDLVALGLPALHLKVDEFGHLRVREDPVATPAADFPEAQCLHEAHQVIEAHIGDVSAPDSRKEKVRLHTGDVTERVRQEGHASRSLRPGGTPLATSMNLKDRQ